jgi:GDPmannose 4,6-dehydratase
MPRALITGITGQDGSYLAELLLGKGYEIHGLVRQLKTLETSRIQHLCRNPAVFGRKLYVHEGDLNDVDSLKRAFEAVRPEEVYHLAGQSHVGLSFAVPEKTVELIGIGTVRLLELARMQQQPPKFFYASSSEIFGEPQEAPQDEDTAVAPVSPYGCAKAFATQMLRIYRRSYGLFACNGILFNHESPRRGEDFVTRKICRGAAAIRLGRQQELSLGNLSPRRDWGHARDYVLGMWLALQYPEAEDFVFATGQLHSVQDVVECAFATVQLDWTQYVRNDPLLSRPAEPRQLVGNPAKARRLLGWEPRTPFHELITEMTEAELGSLAPLAENGRVTK